jgi:3-dehydroquinate dehydratase II
MSKKILVLNGPNLNMLGTRQPEIYGRETLDDVKNLVTERAAALGFEVDFRQSNHEGQLVDWIQEARKKVAGVVINPAAYTHTSVAIRDALLACEAPVVEVHIANIHKREPFRHHSYVSDIAVAVVAGLGIHGYTAGVEAIARVATAAAV